MTLENIKVGDAVLLTEHRGVANYSYKILKVMKILKKWIECSDNKRYRLTTGNEVSTNNHERYRLSNYISELTEDKKRIYNIYKTENQKDEIINILKNLTITEKNYEKLSQKFNLFLISYKEWI